MMHKLQSMIRLCRINKPLPTFTLLWPGICGLSLAAIPSYEQLALFTCGAFIMRGVADTVNDIIDADVDRKVFRTKNRPMARQDLTEGEALSFLALQLTGGAFLYGQLSTTSQSLAAFSLIPIAIYPYTKRCIQIPQLFLGMTINLALPMGWCHSSEMSILSAPLSVYTMYTGFVVWTLLYDTVYSTMDVHQGDKQAHIHSIAEVLMPYQLNIFLHLCTLTTSFCFIVSGICEHMNYVFYGFVLLNQVYSHYNIYKFMTSSQSVYKFFVISCLSMGFVFCGMTLSNFQGNTALNIK